MMQPITHKKDFSIPNPLYATDKLPGNLAHDAKQNANVGKLFNDAGKKVSGDVGQSIETATQTVEGWGRAASKFAGNVAKGVSTTATTLGQNFKNDAKQNANVSQELRNGGSKIKSDVADATQQIDEKIAAVKDQIKLYADAPEKIKALEEKISSLEAEKTELAKN